MSAMPRIVHIPSKKHKPVLVVDLNRKTIPRIELTDLNRVIKI